jgi:ribosomal subunit interface protein
MQLPLQITFRDVAPSPSLDERMRTRAAKLERLHDRITSCRVTLEAPHRRQRHGLRYHVRINLGVPGADIVVGHESADEVLYEDAYAAIDAAFDDAQRRLTSFVERQRKDAIGR